MTAVNEEITGRLPWRQLIAPDRIHLNPDNPRKEPRDLAEGMSGLLWRRLRGTRLMLRRAPVGVEFARSLPAKKPSTR